MTPQLGKIVLLSPNPSIGLAELAMEPLPQFCLSHESKPTRAARGQAAITACSASISANRVATSA